MITNAPPADSSTHAVQRVCTELVTEVIFTRGAFAEDNDALRGVLDRMSPPRLLAFVDSGLAEAWPGLVDRVASFFDGAGHPLSSPPFVVPGGERIKDGWDEVLAAIDRIRASRLCRHSAVICLGGGAVLDAVGMAASLVHRGIRLVRMPTTTLSQGDSGVGVKTGINYRGVKNLLGTFAAPAAVVNDLTFLSTLTPELVLDGVAEAFKVAIIKDRDLFDHLERDAARLSDGAAPELHEAVRRSAELHLDHIREGGDPLELGDARPLDFGHWSAHWLEAASSFSIRHGQGVAIGLALDTVLASRAGHLTDDERDRVISTLAATGLSVYHPLLEARGAGERLKLLDGLDEFREHLGGRLSVTWPAGLGARLEVDRVDEADVLAAVALLRRRAEG